MEQNISQQVVTPENSKPQFLCVKVLNQKTGKVIPILSSCPASPDMVISAMQYLSKGIEIVVCYQDKPIDFDKVDM